MRTKIYICDVCKKEKDPIEIIEEAILETIIPYKEFKIRDICQSCKAIEQNHEINRWRCKNES